MFGYHEEQTAAGDGRRRVADDVVARRSRRVLLVEDNEDSRNVYGTILGHGGFTVLVACTGREALLLARNGQPDLILMDISIPEIDGWEVARILKADHATNHIPIIALTAHVRDADRARAGEVGCDGFLAKPVLPTEVLKEVKSRLGSLDLPTP